MPFSCVTIGGRLTRDPELRYIPSGAAIAEFGMAFGETWKGEEKPAFIDVKVWGKSAEFVTNNFRKGQECVVIGSLEMEEWADKQSGAKRSRMTVNATSVKFAGAKREPARDEEICTPNPAHGRDRQPQADDVPF